jgi:hypothetical protein
MPYRTIEKWTKTNNKPTARQLSALFRKCLAQGAAIEVDGLGEFQLDELGEIKFTAQTQPKVFIAYVEEDSQAAIDLCRDLKKSQVDPWLDRERLLPGQNWLRCIENAIDVCDCFVALFSSRSGSKRGQFQSELRYALDCAARIPLGQQFLLPVRIEDCYVPAQITHAIQYVDLFPDWNRGVRRLVKSIRQATLKP